MQNLLSLQNYQLLSIRFQSQHSENYYDILKVSKDCSNREIRDAFVKLSKKFHPDVMGTEPDAKQTAQFVKISQAYQILSKPKSRSAYDQDLFARNIPGSNIKNASTAYHRPWEIKPNLDSNPGPYYGIKGMAKISNMKVALALIGLGIFGAIFGFFSVQHSFTFNRQKLDEKSAEAGLYHAKIRADAEKFGNEQQIRRMIDRMAKQDR